MAVLAYLPTLRSGFAFDDAMIQENRLIRSLRSLPRMLTTGYWEGIERPDRTAGTNLYRPLVVVSLALNYAVGGLDPVGYHAVNILLHVGVSLAVYGLGTRLFLSREAAAVAAALFAAHPLHTEAVAQIVGRAELLMALGVLLALAGHLRAGLIARLGTLVAFALGLLAKEQSVVLPALLVLQDLYTRRASHPRQEGGFARSALPRLLPHAGILAAYLLLRTWVLGWAAVPVPSFLENPLAHVPLGSRLLTASAVAGRYLTIWLWPAPLSPDYSYNQIPVAISLLDGRVLVAALLWGSLLALGVRSFFRGTGAAGFAVGFTLFAFLPTSNLFVPIGTIMGERLFYLPSVGLCWLAGLGWDEVRARIRRPRLAQIRWAVLGAVLLALTSQTVRYGRVWHDNLSLFSYAVEVVPQSAKMHYIVGVDLLALHRKEGESIWHHNVRVDLSAALRKEEAMAHLRRATEIYPDHVQAWNELGRGYVDDSQWDQALAAFQKVILVNPAYPAIDMSIGMVYENMGRWDDALTAFRRAVTRKPDLVQAHRNLARIYERKGWRKAAQAERELELRPTDYLVWFQAGSSFLRLGWSGEALVAFRQAVALKPDMAEAHLALGQAYERLGRDREAAQAYEGLLRLRPQLPEIHRRLAELYATRLGDPARAEAHLRQIQGTTPRPDPQ